MPSRRTAELVTVGVIVGAAAVVTAALAVRAATKHDAPALVEPEYICVIPDVALMSPKEPCGSRSAAFPAASAPVDRGDGATTTASGLRYRVLADGCGTATRPGPGDIVEARYAGWNARGENVTTGVQSGKLPLRAVVPGFAEAMELMHPGERMRVWIPENLAYGKVSAGSSRYGTLVFDVELIGFAPGG